ncbi:hypothetical protein [Xanthobacter sediminis]
MLLATTMLTGVAVIGEAASGSAPALADSGNACFPDPFIANSCIIEAVEPTAPGGDHPGGTGATGAIAQDLQHDFTTPLTDSNGNSVPYELIYMLSQGGGGGSGADFDHTNGGNGGDGGNIAFTLGAGVNVDSALANSIVFLSSQGGAGGEASRAYADYEGTEGTGGQGGDGQTVSVAGVAGTIISQAAGTTAFVVNSSGGLGGNGQSYDEDKHLSASGAYGGAGGNGGSISFSTYIEGVSTLSITSAGAGLSITSAGGGGGGGGNAESGIDGATGG